MERSYHQKIQPLAKTLLLARSLAYKNNVTCLKYMYEGDYFVKKSINQLKEPTMAIQSNLPGHQSRHPVLSAYFFPLHSLHKVFVYVFLLSPFVPIQAGLGKKIFLGSTTENGTFVSKVRQDRFLIREFLKFMAHSAIWDI